MRIVVKKISFNRWKAEFIIDGIVYGTGIGARPGCAMKDAVNEVYLKHGDMPSTEVIMEVTEWN